ncbi:MAG: hypothetical protein ACP5PB_08125 [Acidimicrobiales bacterium]
MTPMIREGARRVGAVLGGVLILVVAMFSLPAAAATGASVALRTSTPPGGGVELTAQVTPVTAPVTVDYYVHLEEFAGAPLLLIGSTTTNATGVASVVYQPTWSGPQDFVATAVTPSGTVLATTTLTVQATKTDPFAGSVESLRPDGIIGRWVVVALLTLLLAMWFALLAVVVRVQQGPRVVR